MGGLKRVPSGHQLRLRPLWAAVWSGRGRGRRGDSGLGRVGRISRYHTATFFTNFRVTRGGAEPLGDVERGNRF